MPEHDGHVDAEGVGRGLELGGGAGGVASEQVSGTASDADVAFRTEISQDEGEYL